MTTENWSGIQQEQNSTTNTYVCYNYEVQKDKWTKWVRINTKSCLYAYNCRTVANFDSSVAQMWGSKKNVRYCENERDYGKMENG